MKFRFKKDMGRHVDEVHLKKRSFSCKEDGCQQKFGQRGDLETGVNKKPKKSKLSGMDFEEF